MTHAAFDKEHRLTTDRISMRAEGKVTIEVALFLSLKSMFLRIFSALKAAAKAFPVPVPAVARVREGSSGAVRPSRRTAKSGSLDYESVSISAHGLLVDEEGDSGADREAGRERDRDRDRDEEVLTECSSTDDNITIVLSPLSLHPGIPPNSSIPAPLSDSGKATYSFLCNSPTAHIDLERAQSLEAFFRADSINVLSGEANLFCSDGLTMTLKRFSTSQSSALHSYSPIAFEPFSVLTTLLLLTILML